MIPPIVIESLELRMFSDSKLELTGTLSSESAQAQLALHFKQLHHRLSSSRASACEIDLRGLNLVNASAIRLFIDWISNAGAAGYRLIFHVDSNLVWHRLSFDVLRSLAPDTVEVAGLAGPAPAGAETAG